MTSSPIPAARSQYLLDLLAQVPDPRKQRGRRHPLAGLLAAGIAAAIAGSRSFAAIGQWAADACEEVLAGLGAARGAAKESTFRRAFALVSPDVLDRVLGAWLWTKAVQAGDRLVIAIDGKTVRGARNKDGKAPHLVAALAHGIGAVLGQVTEHRYNAYRPAPLPTSSRHGVYSANLVILILALEPTVSASRLFPGSNAYSEPSGMWHRRVLLWRSAMTEPDWTDLALALSIRHTWLGDIRDLEISLSATPRRNPEPIDPYWHYRYPSLQPRPDRSSMALGHTGPTSSIRWTSLAALTTREYVMRSSRYSAGLAPASRPSTDRQADTPPS